MLDGTLIYKKMEPRVSFQILHDETQLNNFMPELEENGSFVVWLMRESRVSGCLTIDSIRYHLVEDKIYHKESSYRFILVQTDLGKSWQIINNREKCLQLQERNQSIYLCGTNIDGESHADELTSLIEKIDSLGFDIDFYVIPSRQQATRNSAYSNYSQSEYLNAKAKKSTDRDELEAIAARLQALQSKIAEHMSGQECPISLNSIGEQESFAIAPSGHVFECSAIEEWLKRNPSNPLTREYLTKREMLISRAPLRTACSLSSTESILKTKKLSFSMKKD